MDRATERLDASFFGERPMETPSVAGAATAMRTLSARFERRLHIVSKAGPKIAALTRRWFAHECVVPALIDPERLHFAPRAEEKQQVCERLRITHFVDDRADVLVHLISVPHRFLFLGGRGNNAPPIVVPDGVVVVSSWPGAVSAIGATLE